jgi:hypothetical protein
MTKKKTSKNIIRLSVIADREAAAGENLNRKANPASFFQKQNPICGTIHN